MGVTGNPQRIPIIPPLGLLQPPHFPLKYSMKYSHYRVYRYLFVLEKEVKVILLFQSVIQKVRRKLLITNKATCTRCKHSIIRFHFHLL